MLVRNGAPNNYARWFTLPHMPCIAASPTALYSTHDPLTGGKHQREQRAPRHPFTAQSALASNC